MTEWSLNCESSGDEALLHLDAALMPAALEARLRHIGAQRYHDRHPFHRLLHDGQLTRGQLQAWALNRYFYQSRIPIKDAHLMARFEKRTDRLIWRQRIIDHDGDGADDPGGIERWLKLAEGLGLHRGYVESCAGVLPATRFAVEAYIHFVRERSLLEAVASSLTELFAPGLISRRVKDLLSGYDFVQPETLSYFEHRLDQAPRDTGFALGFVKREAPDRESQRKVLAALLFKCQVLWAQLDALYYAYVSPGHVPPGAFRPADC